MIYSVFKYFGIILILHHPMLQMKLGGGSYLDIWKINDDESASLLRHLN